MKVRTMALTAFLFAPAISTAQSGASQPVSTPPVEASQLHVLVGQWDLVVRPAATTLAARIHGAPRLVGTWKAWSDLDGWGIEDELRVTDRSGNPALLSHSIRVFDRASKKWKSESLDVYQGVFSAGTGEWRDGQLFFNSQGTEAGRAYLTRTRYYDITPTSFHWQQDRSFDDGRSWTEAVLRIDATRVATVAPR